MDDTFPAEAFRRGHGRLTIGQLGAAVETGEIDTVVIAMTDMQGRLIGKRLTARYFLETSAAPQLFCNYLLATDMEMALVPGYSAASWSDGYGDFQLRPDLTTMRRVPWLPGTAIILADVSDADGQPLAHSPRQVLRRQIERLEGLGLLGDMAAELEFYLFNTTYDSARKRRYHNLKPSSWYAEDGHIFQTSKDEPYIRTLRNMMEAADIPIEGSKAEWSAGQQEVNIQYAGALETCDRLVLYKNGAKEIAHGMGKSVSFMAKLDETSAGNSCHIHLSLRDRTDGSPVFPDPTSPDGMSEVFRQFLAGAMAHARDATYFFAPNVNSYKRFNAGTFAPTRIAWSIDNRTAAYRVLGRDKSLRFECRVPGADANPYLAFAALIACGIAGLQEKLRLPDIQTGDIYRSDVAQDIPASLNEAADALERSSMMIEALGADTVRHYARAARWEIAAFEKAVTDWEKIRLFERC